MRTGAPNVLEGARLVKPKANVGNLSQHVFIKKI